VDVDGNLTYGDVPLVDEAGTWVGESAGLQGDPGPAGEPGDDGYSTLMRQVPEPEGCTGPDRERGVGLVCPGFGRGFRLSRHRSCVGRDRVQGAWHPSVA